MVIIGAGPAGLTAALYAARGGLDVIVIESMFAGGQAAIANIVDNYPGFPDGIDGPTLMDNFRRQAERFGAVITYNNVVSLDLSNKIKRVILENEYEGSKTLHCKAVILAMGAAPRKLGLPLEDTLTGRGVSYCATCDGAFYRGKRVAVVGGGDTAVEDALFLSSFCEKVYLIHRRDKLRANTASQRELMGKSNVEIIWNAAVSKINGSDKLQGIEVRDVSTDNSRSIEIEGLFIAIGNIPNTTTVKDVVALDDGGYILTDERMRTNIHDVFAVGDIRQKHLRQILTAANDGAIAAFELTVSERAI